MDESKIPWIGFNLVKGIGPARLNALISKCGDIQAAWNAPPSLLEETGLSKKLIDAMVKVRESGLLERTLAKIISEKINLLTWDDADYPDRLKDIDQSPPVLYYSGSFTNQDHWAVAVVGTRKASVYGKQVTKEIVTFLARNGITIISGLARGIDGVAHQAALDSGGRTIAVMGNGLDTIYPPEHRLLAEQIRSNGSLMSDYAPGVAPEAINFPPRNRIISGLSQAVLVIEAGEKSGALITAAFAAEHGREVFAVPGNIFSPLSKGTNLLIREGAHILLNGQDVLELLNLENVFDAQAARNILPSDITEAKLMNLLSNEPLYIDEILHQADLSIEQVTAALTMMELKGMIRQVGSMRYIAVREDRLGYEVEEINA